MTNKTTGSRHKRRAKTSRNRFYRLPTGHRRLIEQAVSGPVLLRGNGALRAGATLQMLGLGRVDGALLTINDGARSRLDEERRLEAIGVRRILDPIELFWSKVQKTETCWLWTEGHDKDGYGRFAVTIHGTNTQRHLRAHRYSFELAHGRPPSKYVLHSCDRPACVRPDHLREGTAADNAQDSLARGRHTSQKRPS